MSELPYKVEYPRNRSACHYSKCRDVISKNSLRISVFKKRAYSGNERWLLFHPGCFFNTVKNVEVGDFDNFDNLKWEDQKLLQELIAINAEQDDDSKPVTNSKEDFQVEYSSTNHGKCYRCDDRIKKDSVQVTQIYQSRELGKVYHSLHWECFCQLPEFNLFPDISQISGYDSLKPDDKQTLKKPIKSGNCYTAEMADQNKKLFAVIDNLESLKREYVINLLKHNNQFTPHEVREAKNVLADRLIFGALDPCPECSGLLNFKSGLGYKCTGRFSEWCKCDAVILDPPRKIFVIPDHFKKLFAFFNTFEPCVERRLVKVSAPSCITNTNDLSNNNTRRPLRGMHFLIDENIKHNKDDLEEVITKLGGLVVDEVHENLTAIVTNKSTFKKNSQVMKDAKKYGIQVVSKDFVNEAEDFNDTPVSLIVKKNICQWGSSPSQRVARTIAKSVKMEDLQDNMSPLMKEKIKSFVIDEYNGEKFSVTLGNTEIRTNLNNFFKIQILKDPQATQSKVFLVQSWGRIGTNIGGSNYELFFPFECRNFFKRVYLSKTGNFWENRNNFVKKPDKMYPINTVGDETMDVKFSAGNINQPVARLLMFIFDFRIMEELLKEYKIDTTKMPLGMLESKTMDEAFKVLGELQRYIQSSDRPRIIEASNRFYTLIPHSFGLSSLPILDTLEKIRSKWEMTDTLKQMAIAYEIEKNSVIDQHYLKLKVHIAVLDINDRKYNLIETYLNNTHGHTHNYRLKIEDVFEVKRCGEHDSFAPFSKFPNRKLLWHGSRSTNFAGILSQGLRIAPPEAPSSGYMFGKGIYFADMVTKSANYCFMSMNNPTGLLLLCEVALGEMYEKIDAEYIVQLPNGKHSVWGKGHWCPNPLDLYICSDGVIVPCGRPIVQNIPNVRLHYNEFIVYNVHQIRIKYLVRVKLKN